MSSSITITTESLNAITDNLTKIIEQIKALSVPKKTLTITFTDTEKTYVSHEYCDLFNGNAIGLNISSQDFDRFMEPDVDSATTYCSFIKTVLFDLKDQCTEEGYTKLYKQCRTAIHAGWKRTTNLFNNIPCIASTTTDPKNIEELGPCNFSSNDRFMYMELSKDGTSNADITKIMHDILKRSVDEKVYKLFQH